MAHNNGNTLGVPHNLASALAPAHVEPLKWLVCIPQVYLDLSREAANKAAPRLDQCVHLICYECNARELIGR